jgi:predicted O-methyltransferase YrrM
MQKFPAEQVLREIETRGLPIVGRHKGQVIIDVIRKIQPKRVLEIGTLIGYSTILMAKELHKDAEIITIEIDPEEAKQARNNINRAKVSPRVSVLVGDAFEILPTIKGELDLVFIDAEKDKYLGYLQLVEERLHPKSVVIADNVGMFASYMQDYLYYVRKSKKYISKFIPVGGDGLEISTRL